MATGAGEGEADETVVEEGGRTEMVVEVEVEVAIAEVGSTEPCVEEAFHIAAYSPDSFIKSLCVPCSAILPSFIHLSKLY